MITYEIISNQGERDYNEDYAGVSEHKESRCFVLADGLGGHGGGGEASKLVADYILNDFREHGEVSQEYLRHCFEESQRILMEEQNRQGRTDEMKTTLVVLLVDEDMLQWGHIGDSRLYCFNNGKLKSRTLDHSVPQMLVAAGEIREEQIRHHADRNRLLRVMGIPWDSPRYQLGEPTEREKHMSFLLCTDGFWEWIHEKVMQSTLKKAKDPKEWIASMEKEVQKNGEGNHMDNYSAIAVFV